MEISVGGNVNGYVGIGGSIARIQMEEEKRNQNSDLEFCTARSSEHMERSNGVMVVYHDRRSHFIPF